MSDLDSGNREYLDREGKTDSAFRSWRLEREPEIWNYTSKNGKLFLLHFFFLQGPSETASIRLGVESPSWETMIRDGDDPTHSLQVFSFRDDIY